MRLEREVLMRLADSGRRTQAMKREGTRRCRSSEGVAVPDGEGELGLGRELLVSLRDRRMPDRIAMPRVPC